MLASSKVHATLPATDLDRAKTFYGETLGLQVEFETPGGVMYSSADGTRLLVFPSPNPNRGGHTQVGWAVEDIDAEASFLRERGVAFEEYDYPQLKTVNGVADVAAGRAAWFKDSEGNLLGLIQLAG